MKGQSLILAQLTKEDFENFHAGKVPYSGSAADPHYDADPTKWGPYAPYLATMIDVLPEAIKALKWNNFDLIFHGGQWFATKSKEEKPKIDLEILLFQIELANVS